MKWLTNFTIAAILFCSSTVFAQALLKTDSVYITGAVANYAKYKDSVNSVQFIINDIVSGDQLTYRAKINSKGVYKIAFIKTGAQDIYIAYNDNLQDIFVSPGEHLQVDFDADKFSTSLIFAGDGAQVNRNLKEYLAALDAENLRLYPKDDVGRFRAMAMSTKDDQPLAFKKFMAARYVKEKAFLTDYISKHQLTPTFIKWAETNLKYEYLQNLMRYPWMHPRYNQMKDGDFKLPAGYYDFIYTATLDDPELAMSSNYGAYLAEYHQYLAMQVPAAQRIAYLARQPASFGKDVILSLQMYAHLRDKQFGIARQNLAAFKSAVANPLFENRVLAAYNKAVGPVNQQLKQTVKTEGDILFAKLISKYPNKVIYVDFWGTWCSPCRAEMPNARVLRSKFINKDVVFLYLGVQSVEKAWKAMITDLDIKGEHYLLNKNEFSALAERFQISGIPRYILVNKHGLVIDDNASRPGDRKLKQQIEALLAAK